MIAAWKDKHTRHTPIHMSHVHAYIQNALYIYMYIYTDTHSNQYDASVLFQVFIGHKNNF